MLVLLTITIIVARYPPTLFITSSTTYNKNEEEEEKEKEKEKEKKVKKKRGSRKKEGRREELI